MKQSETTAIAEMEVRAEEDMEDSTSSRSRSMLSDLGSVSKTQQVSSFLDGLSVGDDIGDTKVKFSNHVTDESTFHSSTLPNETSNPDPVTSRKVSFADQPNTWESSHAQLPDHLTTFFKLFDVKGTDGF